MNFLVDLETVKINSYIEGDVNNEKLTVSLSRVQDMYIKPIVGTKQMKRLLQGVEDNDLTALEETLIDYILKVIYPSIELESVTHQNIKIRNKSVGTASDQYVRAGTDNDNKNLYDKISIQINFYRNELIGYLQDNIDSYPLYKECSNLKEDLNGMKEQNDSYDNIFSII